MTQKYNLSYRLYFIRNLPVMLKIAKAIKLMTKYVAIFNLTVQSIYLDIINNNILFRMINFLTFG